MGGMSTRTAADWLSGRTPYKPTPGQYLNSIGILMAVIWEKMTLVWSETGFNRLHGAVWARCKCRFTAYWRRGLDPMESS